MQIKSIFILSRNLGGRPTLMHSVDNYRSDYTKCGWEIKAKTRQYVYSPIHAILCKKCAAIEGVDLG